jgi:hypothetical protein
VGVGVRKSIFLVFDGTDGWGVAKLCWWGIFLCY